MRKEDNSKHVVKLKKKKNTFLQISLSDMEYISNIIKTISSFRRITRLKILLFVFLIHISRKKNLFLKIMRAVILTSE